MVTKKVTKWKYHVSHSFVDAKTGEKTVCITNLYQIGVYAIINGKSNLQFNWSPAIMVKIERLLQKQVKSGEITDLIFGREIVVIVDDGFFKELEDEI